MAKEKGKLRFIHGVPVRALPPTRTVLSQLDLDRERWIFVAKPLRGTSKLVQQFNREFPPGRPAGHTTRHGYRRVRVNGQNCAEHRLIWKIVHGKEPRGFIDHINGIRDDNRPENLRDVTPAENAMNAVRGRWAAETRARHEADKAARARRIEERDLKQLARLKAKYAQPAG